MRRSWIAIILVSWWIGLASHAREDEQWNQFRGPGGRGFAASSAALPVAFGPEENLLWKCPLPSGVSSPCIWGDRIFVTGCTEDELETIAIDRTTGEVLWRRAVTIAHQERLHRINSAASATPTTDGERVFVYFGAFGMLCYDFAGEEQWRREMGFPINIFGTAASPIVAGDYLILKRDTQQQSSLEAIDRATGETIWKTDRAGFKSGWSTPTLWRHDDIDELLVLGVWWLTSYDITNGAERWSVPGLTDEPIVTPVTGDGLVFVTSYNMNSSPEALGLPEFEVVVTECDEDGDRIIDLDEAKKNKSILSRQDADGEGDHPLALFFRFLDEDRRGGITEQVYGKIFAWLGAFEHANALVAVRPGDGERQAEIAWRTSAGIPECPSPLYYEGRIYLVKNGGMVSCLDAVTGELKYRGRLDSRGPCYASPVAGDGKIYSASARGVVTVLAAGDELRVLAHNDVGERIMATPALVDGKVYVRAERTLFAFGSLDSRTSSPPVRDGENR